MTKSKIFFVLSLSFLSGVFVASLFRIDSFFILILFASALALFVINHQNKMIIVASAAVLFLALGIWRTNVSLNDAKNNLADQKLGPTEFIGIISKEPEISENSQKIEIISGGFDYNPAKYKKNDSQKEWRISKLVYWCKSFFRSGEEKVFINAGLYPIYHFGDELKVKCILQEPKNYENSRFDYQMYLAKGGIYRICNKADILILRNNRGNAAYAFILNIKDKFEEKLSAVFPDPEGAYLKGLLLGGSRRMTNDISTAFQRTGTTHTVAVSGYNVTIVAAFLMEAGIIIGLWRQQVFSFALIGIILFVLMTGAPSSAVRAGIMGGLIIWAMKEGRLANSTNAILLAASAMLSINPLLLRYDTGFQLSFLATIGIVQLSPLLEKFFWRRGRAPKIIQETVILTMSAIIFVLPIIFNSFEKLPLVSPIANFVILPAIPVIMGLGFAAGIAGFIFVPLGKLIGFVPYILLKLEIIAVQWMGNLTWASVEVKNFGWKYIIVYYSFLFLALHYFKRRDKKLSMQVDEK